jgi:hypothetical protein
MRTASLAAVLALSSIAAAQSGQLYGLTFAGTLYTIDRATGAATFIGATGHGSNAASGMPSGEILSMSSNLEAYIIDPVTGATTSTIALNNAPVLGLGPRGLAVDSTGTIWAVMSPNPTTEIDTLARIDLAAGTYTVVGLMGQPDIQGLACDPNDNLFALGIFNGGSLHSVNKTTGACTLIGGGTFGGDQQALEFDDTGACFAARANLLSVNTATGVTTLVGPTGQTDFRSMAFIGDGGNCYPDCDGDDVLTLADFGCFQTKFALGDLYADCNNDLVLNLADFGCFQTAFAIGCP